MVCRKLKTVMASPCAVAILQDKGLAKNNTKALSSSRLKRSLSGRPIFFDSFTFISTIHMMAFHDHRQMPRPRSARYEMNVAHVVTLDCVLDFVKIAVRSALFS